MQYRSRPVHDLRSLPPRQRAEALRQLLRKRLPHIPRAVVRFSPRKPVGAPGGGLRSRHGKGIHSLTFAAGLLAAVALALAPARGVRAGTLDLAITTNAIHTGAWARRTPLMARGSEPRARAGRAWRERVVGTKPARRWLRVRGLRDSRSGALRRVL
jgi:hypothetical protein